MKSTQKLEENIRQMLRQKPMAKKDLIQELRADPEAVEQILREMQAQGLAIELKKGKRLADPESVGYIRGRVMRNPKGFAFLKPLEEGREDLFIPANEMKDAMNGDTVLARLLYTATGAGEKRECSVHAVLSRANQVVVGTYEPSGREGYVKPDDKRIGQSIRIPQGALQAAVDEKVVVRITQWPMEGRLPVGNIIEVLGHKDEVGTDILSIVKRLGLGEAFPQEVAAEAEKVPQAVPAEALEDREDLRSWQIITIDGADAKDLDDAISLTYDGNFHLGVHIADVSHYVRENTPIDREALARGTSVYLIDRVLPMLPISLSNGICSLNPNVDRLTLSVLMEITPQGQVQKARLARTVIRTTGRLTYEGVNRLFEADLQPEEGHLKTFEPVLTRMQELAQILGQRRQARGSIDFDIEEVHITLDKEGRPTSIAPRERGPANRMIEEFMLIANETVAQYAHEHKLPFIYRIHERPEPEKMIDFAKFIENFGYKLPGVNKGIRPLSLQKLLAKVAGKPENNVISRVMLRSLKKARYAPVDSGHFGLAAKNYCHFTSPIRRYPDLFIHRVLSEHLIGMQRGRLSKLKARLEPVSQQCSERERVAMEAERAVDDLKKAEYMQQFVGDQFTGCISGVTGFGIFVELPNTVEGLVHVTALEDDYYEYNEAQYLLRGTRSKRVFRLGDTVTVQVVRVNLASAAVDFILVE